MQQTENIQTNNVKHPDTRPLMVSIRCITYNHEPYIRQCLEGFVMQKTNFRFEAIVHDDASTDGTATIIREYAEKYPDIIKPIYETENQYSKHDGSLRRIMDEACTGKYIAFCEGDDYWTDPYKLQKQVDFMELHKDYSLCFHDFKVFRNHRFFDSNYGYPQQNGTVSLADSIQHGGWVFTASRLYRREYQVVINNLSQGCCVGDYPAAIALALNGKVYYMNDKMCVYRQGHGGSWMTNYKNASNEKKKKIARDISMMLQKCNEYSDNKYEDVFCELIFKQLYDVGDWESLGKWKYNKFIHNKPYSRQLKYYFCCIKLLWLWKLIANIRHFRFFNKNES